MAKVLMLGWAFWGAMVLVGLANALSSSPASQLKTVDVSLEPARVCARPGETVTVYVVVTADKPTPLGTVEALFEYDGLKLVSAKGIGCWAERGFMNDPDGINDDLYDGEAFYTLLGGLTDDERMFATPCGTRVMALTFAGDGEVRLVGPNGYADTRVYLPDPPNVNVTGDNTDETDVYVCGGLRRVKARRLP